MGFHVLDFLWSIYNVSVAYDLSMFGKMCHPNVRNMPLVRYDLLFRLEVQFRRKRSMPSARKRMALLFAGG